MRLIILLNVKQLQVTDPEYQEEDFFERKARELPLG